MKVRSIRGLVATAAAAALLVVPAGAAVAQGHGHGHGKGKGHAKVHPANTQIRFKLASHELQVGDELVGSVLVVSRYRGAVSSMEGASLSVLVDGAEVAVVTTDADGKAAVSYFPTEPGEHVVKVVYAGDDSHRRAQRAQGFEVLSAE